MFEWWVREPVLDLVLNELESRQPDLVEGLVVGPAGVADRESGHAHVRERFHPRAEDGRDRFVPLQIDAADGAGAVVDVEVAGELGVRRLGGHRPAIGEVLGDIRSRSEQTVLFTRPKARRTVRLSGRPVALRMRIASIITAEPAALSVAPVPVCHESKCAPSITSSSALFVPGMLADDVERIEVGVVEGVADVHLERHRNLLVEDAERSGCSARARARSAEQSADRSALRDPPLCTNTVPPSPRPGSTVARMPSATRNAVRSRAKFCWRSSARRGASPRPVLTGCLASSASSASVNRSA